MPSECTRAAPRSTDGSCRQTDSPYPSLLPTFARSTAAKSDTTIPIKTRSRADSNAKPATTEAIPKKSIEVPVIKSHFRSSLFCDRGGGGAK